MIEKQMEDSAASDVASIADQPHIILPEIPEEKPFSERLKSLLSLDCVRLSRILETMQYAVLYTFLCIPVGTCIDALFTPLYPRTENKDAQFNARQAWHAIGVATLQVVLFAVAVIYIRKVVALFPFVFNLCPSRYVQHYHVDEVVGESALALILVGVQVSLVDNLVKIRKHFFPPKD